MHKAYKRTVFTCIRLYRDLNIFEFNDNLLTDGLLSGDLLSEIRLSVYTSEITTISKH